MTDFLGFERKKAQIIGYRYEASKAIPIEYGVAIKDCFPVVSKKEHEEAMDKEWQKSAEIVSANSIKIQSLEQQLVEKEERIQELTNYIDKLANERKEKDKQIAGLKAEVLFWKPKDSTIIGFTHKAELKKERK